MANDIGSRAALALDNCLLFKEIRKNLQADHGMTLARNGREPTLAIVNGMSSPEAADLLFLAVRGAMGRHRGPRVKSPCQGRGSRTTATPPVYSLA